MKLTEQGLRTLLAEAQVGDRADCPSSEVLLEAYGGELPRSQRRVVSGHLATCPACAHEITLLRPLGTPIDERRDTAPAPTTASPPSPTGVGPWRRWPLWTAATAALAGLIVIAVALWPPPSPPRPVVRGPDRTGLRLLVPDGALVPRSRCVLRWSAAGPGARYAVIVATRDLVTLHEARGLAETRYRVPARALASVPRHGEVYWRLVATLPSGRILTSALARLRLD